MLEWEEGRNGTRIPKWNGRLLASRVDPSREAVQWAQRAGARVRGVRSAFVLGLGGGFHVSELAHRNPSLRIVVFEPASGLVESFLRSAQVFSNVVVLNPPRGAQLLNEPAVQAAVCESYVVLRHAPSIRCREDEFADCERWLLGRDSQSFYALLQARSRDLQLFSRLGIPEIKKRGLAAVHDERPITIKTIAPALTPDYDERSQIWLALSELVK